jgi:hypothetical protein
MDSLITSYFCNRKKTANVIFLNHFTSQVPHCFVCHYIHSVKPFWHGFCICGGERRAKTMPTLSGSGHSFRFAKIRINTLHRNQSAILPFSGTASRKAVFHRRGVPLRKKGQAPNGPPLIRGKTRGLWGFKGSVALSLIRPVTYRVFRRFANANAKSKAVLYSAVLHPGGHFCPPHRMVSRRPMSKAVDAIVAKLPSIFPPSAVCTQCKDNTKCAFCSFYQPSTANTAAKKVGTENTA